MTAKDGNGHERNERTPAAENIANPLAKRFYNDVSVSDGAFFQILLDGRGVKTPKKRALVLPVRSLALDVAAEWSGQVTHIDPSTMPLTRLANTAIDAVSDSLDDVARDIVSYAASDLVCYRAEGPDDLVRLQSGKWDPILAWAREVLKAHFVTAHGVMPIEQPETALMPVAQALQPHDAFRLTGLHVLTTLTGSALIALAHASRALTADAAWSAAHVDEDYQIELWGEDQEASERRKNRRIEFDAASYLIKAL